MKEIITIILIIITIKIQAQQVKEYYSNGEFQKTGNLKNGKPTGEWKFYYKNGVLEKTGTMKGGIGVGEWKFYDKKGKLEKIGSFNKKNYQITKKIKEGKYRYNKYTLKPRSKRFSFFGRKIGEWKYNNKDGSHTIEHYNDGRKDGQHLEYHYKILYKEGQYSNGRPIGEWKTYYITGEIKKIKKYIDVYYQGQCSQDRNPLEIFTGDIVTYYDNSQIREIKKFDKGKQVGNWESYYKNGQLKEIEEYKIGNDTSTNKNYYKNGQLKTIGYNIRESRRFGNYYLKADEWKTYYKNGQLKEVANYAKGQLTGEYKNYNKTGQPIEKGKYVKGEKEGNWKYYNKKGKIKLSESYKRIFGIKQKIGERKEYYDNEQLKSKTTYNIKARKEGEAVEYYKNGQLKTKQLWESDKLIKVISYFDSKGNPLDKGTIKEGSGTVKKYDSEGVITTIEYLYGEKIDWENSSQLNSLAWNTYKKEEDKEKLEYAIKLIKRSIELKKRYHNTDTYAALLYKTNKYKQALSVAKEAIKIAKKEDTDYKITNLLIKEIEARINK